MKKNLIGYCKLILVTVFLLGAFSCETEKLDQDEMLSSEKKAQTSSRQFDFSDCTGTYQTTNIYAGQHHLVGTLSVEVIGNDYHITYNITDDGYCLVSTHLSVVESPNDFPMTNSGNPKNGHFEFSGSHDCISSYTYVVPTSNGTYIAAHGVVNCVSDVTSDSFTLSLPDQVDVCVTAKGVPESYFDIAIADGNDLSGAHDAWCVDQDASLDNGDCFTGDVYSSYESLPDGEFEHPENFGAVNWLMNQGFIGTEATPELGNYTFGDIQLAIWNLVDDSVCTVCEFTGPYDNDRIDMLVEMALAHNDFVPECGDDVVIIIVPTNDRQSIFITIPAPCGDCDETIWAEGCDFPGNNWAMFFQYGEEV